MIPQGLHRALLRIAHRLRSLWWGWRKPRIRGVSILAFNAAGEVLLVRHSYGRDVWSVPGGGCGKHEKSLDAAKREFAEELRCSAENWQDLGVLKENLQGARVSSHVYRAELTGTPQPDMREIIEARCFALDALPDGLSRRVRPRLEMLS